MQEYFCMGIGIVIRDETGKVLDFILYTIRSHGKFLSDQICNKENPQKYFS